MTAPDPEAEYYQAVEEFFVSRRGDPLFLSNADWLLIRRWRRQGLPLRIVLRGIADALDSHAHSWSRQRKVGSLRYCEAEVEVARERWERALAVGSEPELDVRRTLDGFADDLRAAVGLGASGREAARETIEALGRLDGTEPRQLEPRLMALEARLVAALRRDSEADSLGRLEARVDGVLERYRARLPPAVFKELREQSLVREQLGAHGIPRLSLFGL